MKLTETDKQFKLVAGLLGSIQGFGWFIMSLICIILYLKGDDMRYYQPHSYMEAVQQSMYFVFLDKNYDVDYPGRFINPLVFHVLMWPYLILDLIWFLVSVFLITAKIENTIKTLSKVWSNIVTIISIYDLFVTILLGVQYDKCLGHSIFQGEFCANIILPVLVIAARGFVLWIVNVVFARILFVRIVKKLNAGTVFHENSPMSFQASIYPALTPYGNGCEPEPISPTVNSQNFQNWENRLQSTPTDAHPSQQNLNQNQSEQRVTSNIHNMNGGRFQHNPILSTNGSSFQNLNRNRSDHFDHYNTSLPTNSNGTTPNLNSRQYALVPLPNFVTNNGPQSENRFQYPVRVPRPSYDRAPVSLPSRY